MSSAPPDFPRGVAARDDDTLSPPSLPTSTSDNRELSLSVLSSSDLKLPDFADAFRSSLALQVPPKKPLPGCAAPAAAPEGETVSRELGPSRLLAVPQAILTRPCMSSILRVDVDVLSDRSNAPAISEKALGRGGAKRDERGQARASGQFSVRSASWPRRVYFSWRVWIRRTFHLAVKKKRISRCGAWRTLPQAQAKAKARFRQLPAYALSARRQSRPSPLPRGASCR